MSQSTNCLVDWDSILPTDVKVTYSTLAVPDFERDSLNRDIAEIVLANGQVIDIEWSDDIYEITLYDWEIDDYQIKCLCSSEKDIVPLVKHLSETSCNS